MITKSRSPSKKTKTINKFSKIKRSPRPIRKRFTSMEFKRAPKSGTRVSSKYSSLTKRPGLRFMRKSSSRSKRQHFHLEDKKTRTGKVESCKLLKIKISNKILMSREGMTKSRHFLESRRKRPNWKNYKNSFSKRCELLARTLIETSLKPF